MPELITPEAFNERFTLYLNTTGEPVQRALREMTAGEVLQAIQWSGAEAERLEREAEPAQAMAIAAEEGRDDVLNGMTRAELEAAGMLLRASGEATNRHARLLERVMTILPKGALSRRTKFGDAVRRHWPGGR